MDDKKREKVRGAQIAKWIGKVLLSAVILLVLAVGGGVAYTWYMGQQDIENTAAVATPAEPPKSTVIEPRKPYPGMTVGASVSMLTSPVAPGANASITVKTVPTADCTITVEYNKVPSRDSGLKPKAADAFGIVSWSWTVDQAAPIGTWPAKVTCTYGEKSAVVIGDLIVAAQ